MFLLSETLRVASCWFEIHTRLKLFVVMSFTSATLKSFIFQLIFTEFLNLFFIALESSTSWFELQVITFINVSSSPLLTLSPVFFKHLVVSPTI